jgi:hypothetical protein
MAPSAPLARLADTSRARVTAHPSNAGEGGRSPTVACAMDRRRGWTAAEVAWAVLSRARSEEVDTSTTTPSPTALTAINRPPEVQTIDPSNTHLELAQGPPELLGIADHLQTRVQEVPVASC